MKKNELDNERVKALKNSLAAVNKAYDLKVMRMTQIYHKKDNAPYAIWKKNVEDEQKELLNLAFSAEKIKKELKKLNVDMPLKKEPTKTGGELLIDKLLDYLDKLADKITKLEGTTNLPINVTKEFDNRAWVVKNYDLEEANNIIDIIKILKKKYKHGVRVYDIAMVDAEYVDKFKELVQKTKYFHKEVLEEELKLARNKK